jgi:hypothetical protein
MQSFVLCPDAFVDIDTVLDDMKPLCQTPFSTTRIDYSPWLQPAHPNSSQDQPATQYAYTRPGSLLGRDYPLLLSTL